MARALYTRLDRPSAALSLLCFCLLAPIGLKAIIGADNGTDTDQQVLVASVTPQSEMAGSIAPLAAPSAVIAALKGRTGSPSYLDPPAALPILPGANWRYFKGISSAPPSTWNNVGFDDTSWLLGPSGFGYGDGDDATVLSDMQNPPNTPGYVSVYIRREFDIPDLGSIAGVKLTIDYDDAYVVYVNGSEVARSANMGGTVGTPPPYNATAASNHEASAGSGGNPPNVVSIPSSALVQGTNAIGIQGHNGTLGSSDLSLIPKLEIELPPNAPPDAPSNPSPADLQTGQSTNPELCVTVDDAEGSPLDVTFFGREESSIPGDPFTIIALPDTQYYSASYPATFAAQTEWIRDNRVARNIVFATELGDCTDQGGIQAQWDNATAALSILENPVTTMLADGIPFGVAVGNHDQSPNNLARSGSDENITTALYNQNLGKSRFSGRGYFGGNFPLPGFADSMDNHYELFSASGMDFIIFHLEWDNTSCSWPSDGSAPTGTLTTCQDVLTWVRGLLTGPYANRRAMITTHFIGSPTSGGTGTPSFSPQGQSIFNAIKTLPNVFMLLGGHLDQADHRTDLATDGHEIHTVISDYQSRPNGGNGWLRIMTFDPQTDSIHIETYSPNFDRFINKLNDGTPSSHADNLAPTENEITLGYDMDAGLPFAEIGTDTGTPAGTQACVSWPGLQVNTTYEWYAVATDGASSTAGPRQSFTTTTSCTTNEECDDTDLCTTDVCNGSLVCEHAPVANCCHTAGDCDDANVCTDDACTSNACFNTNNSGSCSDSNACTVGDFCSGGSCAPGFAAVCDDGNLCTTDSCVAPTGCSSAYTPTTGCCSSAADCNDGNAGTTDTCTGGNCQNVAAVSCDTPAECDDGSVCTIDSCSGGNAAAISFSGTAGNRVQFPIGTGVDYLNDFGTGSFTIEGWVYTDGGAASLTGIFRAGRQQAFPQVVIQLTGTGNLQIAGSVETNTTGTQVDVTGPALTANTWTHVALVVDRTAGAQQLRLHVNGGAPTVATATVWATNPVSWTTEASLLGAARDGSGNLINPFDGRLDEFRIWNYARTQAEIAADMGNEITTAPGLVHRWGMEEGSGTTTADSVGTSTGTLTTTTAPAPAWLTSSAQVPDIGSGTCQYTNVSCDDGNVCTTDSCNAISGCAHAAANEGGTCDDANACTASDICTDGACAGIPNGTCCISELDCDDGNSCTTDSCEISSANAFALSLDGTNDYVTMGIASGLGASTFTLETWFNWTGGGVPLSASGTGTGGLPTTTIPILSKGAAQAETPANVNMNYFMGIVNGRLAGDFEDAATGLNHPVCTAATEPAISTNTWHHAAATYDGTRWRLYLDGAELPVDTACSNCSGGACTVSPGATPESGSIQHFGLGTTLNSSGTAAGFFQGLIDEARVWNVSRTQADIQADMNTEVTSAPGLRGRWGFTEGAGATAGDSAAPAENGTLTGGPLWEDTNKPALGEGVCQFAPAVGASCDDTNLCLTGDTCDASGVCQPGTTPLDCDDSNVCTDDTCDSEQGCVNSINVGPCSDGNACTTGDTCDGGTCGGGTTVFCDDADLCTTDSCNPTTGCAYTALVCDDGNLCTDDSCNTGSGCVFTPDDTNTCADGDLCDGSETCSAGTCQAGAPLSCDDANPCNGTETCSPVSGCVGGTPLNCDDLNPCTVDSCGPAGCEHASNPATCDDGDACSTDSCGFVPSMSALAFDGTNDFVTMSTAPGLGATRFTLETWFYWTGGGAGLTGGTGTGGLPAGTIPLFGKGAPQAETPANLNMNYFLGIANSRVAGDFEDSATGLNHPVCTAATEPAVTTNTWHHAAATYDGTRWRLYLDGTELSVDTACSTCSGGACTVSPGATPESGSVQHFGLGATLNSSGTAAGFFQGRLDEVRVWDHARNAGEILLGKNRRIVSGLGLLGRWGLDEGTGTSTADSATPAENGTLTNFTFTASSGWVAGAPALSTAECSYPNAPTGTSCDDGNVCTAPDQCTTGICGGSAVAGCCLTAADCNDSDVCTSDTCVANVCEYPAIPGCTSCSTDAQCDDSNTCTTGTCNTANDAAADLRTATDYINLGQDATANNFINNFGTNSFTIEGWFYADALTVDLTSIFRGGRQGAFPQVVVQLRTGTTPWLATSVERSAGGSGTAQIDAPAAYTAAAAVTLNAWHHMALVMDRAAPQLRTYLDGVLVGTVTPAWGAADTVNMPAGDATMLGYTRDSTGGLINNFNGRVDEVRIWSLARTQTQIQADMNKELVAAPNLVHRWSFNEASGNAIDDPGTFDGSFVGGATRITTNLPLFGNDLCVYAAANEGLACDDANACTVTTTCGAGVCGGGSAVNCDDSNLCTMDTCDSGTGCSHAPVVCSPGYSCSPVSGQCEPSCTPTGPDTDCDGVDDDCDGTPDDEYAPVTSCFLPGVCAAGNAPSTCVGGVETACQTGTPVAETCNGLDDDCDGVNDNGNPGGGAQCGSTDVGECAFGTTQCTGGSVQCVGSVGPTAELCNGLDDDCDGTVDNGNPGGGAQCGTTDVGECAFGTTQCTGGSVQCVGSVEPVAELCDNLDNDCDGTVDNGNPGGGLVCSTGAPGICGDGLTQCSGGSIVCVGTQSPATPNVVTQIDSAMRYRANDGTTPTESSVLVQIDSPMRYLANSSDPGIGTAWVNETFNDTGWSSGTYGVGYDTAAPPNALSLIRTTAPAGTFSVFTRATFTVADVTAVNSLFLGADYDDGYVAYLNGVEVARSSSMPAGTPDWNTNAALHESSNAAVPNYGTLIDISTGIPLLHNGQNVLAVGVWNSGAPTSTDLVVVPRLSIGVDWTATSFDDSSWTTGTYGVGYDTGAAPNALNLIRTSVPAGTLSVFTRTHFNIPDAAALAAIQMVTLGVDYDDGTVAWINGVEVFGSTEMPLGPLSATTPASSHESSNGAVPNYSPIRDITGRALPALVVGDNVLAIGVWNTSSTSTDMVLVPRLSLGEAETCDGLDNDCNGIVDDGFQDSDNDSVADCVDTDDDGDGATDDQDCQPLDPLSSTAPPDEVLDLIWIRDLNRTYVLSWTDQGLHYDLAGGLASQLRLDGGTQNAACLPGGNDVPNATFDDTRPDPSAGAAYYYLVRSQSAYCGSGTYGYSSSGVEHPTAPCQ